MSQENLDRLDKRLATVQAFIKWCLRYSDNAVIVGGIQIAGKKTQNDVIHWFGIGAYNVLYIYIWIGLIRVWPVARRLKNNTLFHCVSWLNIFVSGAVTLGISFLFWRFINIVMEMLAQK